MRTGPLSPRRSSSNVNTLVAFSQIHVNTMWTDPLQLDSLREQVRMPGGKEKGSHHGREKEIFSDFQTAGGRGVAQSELDPGSTQPPPRCFLRAYPPLEEALRGRGTSGGPLSDRKGISSP